MRIMGTELGEWNRRDRPTAEVKQVLQHPTGKGSYYVDVRSTLSLLYLQCLAVAVKWSPAAVRSFFPARAVVSKLADPPAIGLSEFRLGV